MLRHYDVTFGSIFLKTSIYLLLMTDYNHTKFGLIWSKESKVENVLNRPGEIGLRNKSCVKGTCWDTRAMDSIIKSGQKDTEVKSVQSTLSHLQSPPE